jgi:hypothetical protein
MDAATQAARRNNPWLRMRLAERQGGSCGHRLKGYRGIQKRARRMPRSFIFQEETGMRIRCKGAIQMGRHSWAKLIDAASRSLECGGQASFAEGGGIPGSKRWGGTWDSYLEQLASRGDEPRLLQFAARGSGRRRGFRCREYRRTRRGRLGKSDHDANKSRQQAERTIGSDLRVRRSGASPGASSECRQRRGLRGYLARVYSRSKRLLF